MKGVKPLRLYTRSFKRIKSKVDILSKEDLQE